MTERSVLRVRQRDHIDPRRGGRGETIVEVLRGGKVVATIYGSREGIHIVSDLAIRNRSFLMEGAGPVPSWVIPLLAEGEVCPWCEGNGVVMVTSGDPVICPVCEGRKQGPAVRQ